jgi:uncharacterized DUF497 family protein
MAQRNDLGNTEYRFEWDEKKNRQNFKKHGFDFADAEGMFRGFLLVRPDTREDYGEERWIGIGMISGARRLCSVRSTLARYRPHHLIEKGRS